MSYAYDKEALASSSDTGYSSEGSASGLPLIPDHASYLVGADNHQLGNTGSSILDPTTWGERADNGFKFSVSALTRAVTSTINSAVTVGSWAGITNDSDKVSTKEWLQGMDDDLSQYYTRNQSSIDTVGDVVGMFAPGLGGVKVLNYAQKGIALATEGRAGLSMAAHFGTLPTKQAAFAKLAAQDMANSGNPFTLINANLAKSLGTGYAQNALEMAAFDVAASVTMKDSPLFAEHDMGDIAYNALLGGGMVGAGILGTATAARTIMDIKKASTGVDAATHAYRTVRTEPVASTPANESLAIHLNNIEAIPTVAADDALAAAKLRGTSELRLAELDKARTASHKLAGSDSELGNSMFDVVVGGSSEDASNKLAGVLKTARVSRILPEEVAMNKAVAAGVDTPHAVQYLKLFGADAGKITDRPTTVHIADTVTSESAVLAQVKGYRHKAGQDWSASASLGDVDSIEARYIAAQEMPFDITTKIGAKDIPFLERAYQEMSLDNSLAQVTLKDGSVLSRTDLYKHITDVKGSEALAIQEQALVAPDLAALNLTTSDVAKFVNVSPSYLEGTRNLAKPDQDFFALQAAQAAHTEARIAQGTWKANAGLVKTYLQPQSVKMLYDTSKAAEVSGHEIAGIVALKEQQVIYKQQAHVVTDKYLAGTAAESLVKEIPAGLMAQANRESVGGGLLTSMNADYNSLGSFMQHIGSQVAGVLKEKADKVATTFAASGSKVLTNEQAGTELWKTVQLLRQTPEKYTLIEGELKNVKQVAYEAKIAEAEAAGQDVSKIPAPVFEDAKAPISISLESEGMQQFAKDWDSYHRDHRVHVNNLRTSQGLTTSSALDTVFYIPPVDSRKFPHFAFVVDDSISGTGHMSMIHASSADELQALASKVPTGTGLKVLYKDQSERWHKAMKDYDYDLGINENYIESALKRSGVSGSYFAKTDPKALFEDLMDWRKAQDAGLTRDMVEHRFSSEFAELRRQGAQHDLAATSVKSYIPDIMKGKVSNPYNDYIKAALYETRTGTTPIWSAVNRLAETSISSVVSKLQDTYKEVKSVEDLGKLNSHLQDIGCSVYTDAATHALANHTAPKPVLADFIRKANSMLTFTMLRTDPMNAINNGFGHAVLYGTELPRMIKEVLATGGDNALRLSEATHITLPGTSSKILSPQKLAAQAYSNFFTHVIGEGDSALFTRYKAGGWLPTYTDQMKSMIGNLALRGDEAPADIHTKVQKAFSSFSDMAETYSGNKFAEEMNRFVAADTARMVTDHAVATGAITADMSPAIINTFVNRTQGVMLAAQRPLLFKGAVGQAVGLFQTYQFNMLQQLFRYVGDGSAKSTATLLGLQGCIYGMNGLPAFNAMNNYLVGNAHGNRSHQDIISSTYDVAGKEAGDWLLYGASSNFLLHPDAKVNTYSRGDINPRQVTVIPTSLSDVPLIGAASKLYGSIDSAMSKMDKGADKWTSFLQGVEHSGISRPLSGFAQVMEATANPRGKVYSTTNSGNIVMENDFLSAMTAARLVGAKPLDEAVALDAYHRVQVYKLADSKLLNNLGAGVKATVTGGGVPSPEQIQQFTGEYMKAGGRQENFAKWYNHQVLNAAKGSTNQMVANTATFGSRYYQKIMGGYELSDFNNTGGE